MASKIEKQRILSGTLSLLPPADKLQDGDSLIHDNWRIDQQGQLRSRNGSTQEAGPFGTAGAWLHTLGRSESWRYVGHGTHLYWGSAPAVADLASGFDGNPLGLAFYQGSGWVMNRSKRVRVQGSTVYNWGIAAPVSAPSASAGAVSEVVLNAYTSSGLLSFAGYFDASNTFVDELSSLQFNVNPTINSGFGNVPTVATSTVSFDWFFVTNLSPVHDSTSGGAAHDEDTFHLLFYADNPQAISGIVISLYSDQATLAGKAPIAQANIDASLLTQSPQTYTNIAIRRSIDYDFSDIPQILQNDGTSIADPDALAARVKATMDAASQPHFVEDSGGGVQYSNFGPVWAGQMGPTYPLISAGGSMLPSKFDWTKISGLEIVVKLKDPCKFGIGQMSFVNNVAGSLSGDVTYFVTYVNDAEQESNPSAGVTVTVKNQSAGLTSIPISPDAQVTHRYIYRIGGGLNQALRIGTIFNNTATTYTDQTNNTVAQNLNIVLEVDHGLPPACSGVIGPYLGRLLAYNNATNPARLYWTPAGQPYYFRGADEDAGDWEDAGSYDDPLIAVTEHKTLLVLYKQRSIWRLAGDPATQNPVGTNAKVGVVGPLAVVNAGNYDYFVGPEGVYRFNIDFEEKISGAIDPLFKGDYVQLATGEFLTPIDKTNISKCVLEIVNDRLRLSYPEVGQTLPNAVLIYHVETKRWGRETYVNLATPAPSAMHYEGAGLYLMAGFSGADGGHLYRLETPTNPKDEGAAIRLMWQSRYSDQGLPDNFKYYTDVEIDYQTAFGAETASTLTVILLYDNGSQVTLGTISSVSRTTAIFQLSSADVAVGGGATQFAFKAKNAAIRIVGNATSTCIIHGTYLHWYPQERQAKSFDSGFVGSERVRQVDYLEVVATGTGQAVSYILSSDLPGSLLKQRQFAAFTAPSGRGSNRFRLPSVVEGRNLRLMLGANSAFQLHQARIRQREIGEYIDGTIGEYWESPEFSVAPGRDGELKDLILDYDSSLPGATLQLYSDLPGGTALSLRRTITLPQRTTRDQYVIALEDSDPLLPLPYGTLFKVRITPPNGGIVRLHGRATFRARIIGVSFDGSAGERWETQPLDLLGGVGEFRDVVIVAQTAGAMTFQMLTELPGDALAVRVTKSINTATTTPSWEPIYFRLPGTTKGRLQQFRVTGSFACRIFEVKIYGRRIGGNATDWQWLSVLPSTGNEGTSGDWTMIEMPVHRTADEFSWIEIPVDEIA